MKIFPGMHYTMGGLWVDFNQQTNIPGVFAAGEADYSIHGANRLGANSLLSCIYGGFVAGPQAMAYAKSLPAQEGDGGHAAELARQNEFNKQLLNNPGTENPFKIWRELGDTMTKHATIVRYNAGLDEADAKLVELPRSLRKRQPLRQEPMGQHQLRLHPPALQHAGARPGHRPGARASATNPAEHTTSPTSPTAKTKKFLKTTKGRLRRRRTQNHLRRGRHQPHQTTPPRLQLHLKSCLRAWLQPCRNRIQKDRGFSP